MTGQARVIAVCHLLLRGNRWIPVSVNRKLGPNDRCSPDGAVISATLSAVVEGETIIGWMENSAFTVQDVLDGGTLAAIDLAPTRRAVDAMFLDEKAANAGVVGISSLIAKRRVQEHNNGKLPEELREAAFERATVQILDKLQDNSVIGVLLVKRI
jgi:hypothetical protein